RRPSAAWSDISSNRPSSVSGTRPSPNKAGLRLALVTWRRSRPAPLLARDGENGHAGMLGLWSLLAGSGGRPYRFDRVLARTPPRGHMRRGLVSISAAITAL